MARKRLLMLIIAIAAFALGLVASLRSETPANGSGFNSELRDLYFSALKGDSKAMETANEKAGQRLAANPKDADAMVWHGVGVFFHSGAGISEGRHGDRNGPLPQGAGRNGAGSRSRSG